MSDKIREHAPDMVAVLAGVNDGKVGIAAGVAKDALKKGVHAGKLIREVAAIAGGGGGGRPDSATAGAKDASRLDEALSAAEKIVASLLK